MKNQHIIITAVIFVVLSAVILLLLRFAPEYHFAALEIGNIMMAVLSVTSVIIVKRQINERPQAFIRGVYSATFFKMMVCMVSILVYVMLNRAQIHKPTVFALFGIYIVYTVMETWLLSKLVREKN